MLKQLVVLSVAVLTTMTTSCSKDYHEDDNYVYIKNSDVLCKQMKQEVVSHTGSRGGSYETLDTTSKCMFIKKDSVDYNRADFERMKQLEKELGGF